MRCSMVLLLAACATTPDDRGQLPPPVMTIDAPAAYLSDAPNIIPIRGVPANRTAHLVASFADSGDFFCPPQTAPACFNLYGPASYLGPADADASNTATWTVSLPPGVTAATGTLQAVAIVRGGSLVFTEAAERPIVSALGDEDGDGVTNADELAAGTDLFCASDSDGDGACDGQDLCEGDDATGDADFDRVCDDLDQCVGVDATGDADADGVCDDLDDCTGDDATGDSDADGVCDDQDLCAGMDDAVCVATCGDGVVDPWETCDGDPGQTCADLGFPAGLLVCGEDCTLDTSRCGEVDIIDIATPDPYRACTLDTLGVLRCEPLFQAANTSVEVDVGPWVSIAAGQGQLCATRANDTVTCWNATGVVTVDVPAGAGLVFEPDEDDVIKLRSADDATQYVRHPDASIGAQGWTAYIANDVDVYGAVSPIVCLARDADLACYNSAGTTTQDPLDPRILTTAFDPGTLMMAVVGEGPWVDVAIQGSGNAICGVRPDSRVDCFDVSGAPLEHNVPPHAERIDGVGELLVTTISTGNVQVRGAIGDGLVDRIPDDVDVVAVAPLGRAAARTCWVQDGAADCGGTTPGLVDVRYPTVGTWTAMDLSPTYALWVDALGRVYEPSIYGGPDLSIAEDMRSVSLAGGLCGLDAGVLRCTGGSHTMAPPDEVYAAWATSDPLATRRQFCGIAASDGSLVCSSHDADLENAPAGSFVDVDVAGAPPWAPMPPVGLAVDTSGGLHCWGDAATCGNAPAGLADVVHVQASLFGHSALTSDGTVYAWSSSSPSSTSSGQVFDRFHGTWGINDDGTIGDWTDSGRTVPTGTFDAVVDDVWQVNAGVDGASAVGCGLRPSGALDCWTDAGGAVEMLPLVGTYDRIAASSGVLFARDASTGLTYSFGSMLPQVPVQEVRGSGYMTCWLDAASELGCAGATDDVSSYPTGQTFDSLEAEPTRVYDRDGFCAFGTQSACFGGQSSILQDFPVPEFTSPVFWGANWCWVEQNSVDVGCFAGQSTSSFTPLSPPTQTESITDLALGFGLGCAVLSNGDLDCWGSPFTAGTLPVGSFQQVEVSGEVLALRTDGTLAAFNWVTYQPRSVPSGTFSVIGHTNGAFCGLRTDGSAWCWNEGIEAVRGH